MSIMLENKFPDTFQRYNDIEELEERHPDRRINGLEITEPHFLQFEGCDRGHHAIIEFDGTPYGYDNIIIGTNGASKMMYFLEGGSVNWTLNGAWDIQLLKSDDFIVVDSTLYHIPTGAKQKIAERSFELHERVPQVLDFKTRDKQIEWTGGDFEVYENVDVDESSQSGRSKSIHEQDLRESTKKESYNRLLTDIVNGVEWINDRAEAKNYLNGDFEITDRQKQKRTYMNMRKKYIQGRIGLHQFEQFVEGFLIRNKNYVWVTGEHSDTQISDFSDEDETEKNSAFNL